MANFMRLRVFVHISECTVVSSTQPYTSQGLNMHSPKWEAQFLRESELEENILLVLCYVGLELKEK